mgnify:CR=1 FL=1
MNPKINKLRTELEKNNGKIAALQAKNKELEKQIRELENLDIVGMVREQGMTIVMVSSELQELRSISDRIAIVSEGKLVDILSPNASDADFGLAMSGAKVDGGDLA